MAFPKLMGILNVTPDSFSDGGDSYLYQNAVANADRLIKFGADIIDIGGESTRPGANPVNAEMELERVLPIVHYLKKNFPNIPVSIDTSKKIVAGETLKAGADIINDISGLSFEPEMAEIIAKYNKTLVLMHIKGEPRTMQQKPEYENCTEEVIEFLQKQIDFARGCGIKKIIADPGICFGKTYEHNMEILRNINEFQKLQVPILLGISRKSFINTMLDISNPKQRDIPTLIIHTLLLKNNIDIIRVHNMEYYQMLKKIYNTIC